jgi:hypothetical protein
VTTHGDCTKLGGSCGNVPYSVHFAPVGPGKVNVVDWGNAAGARIENVTVYDHRRGDFTFRTGTSGALVDSSNDGSALTTPQVQTWVNFGLAGSVDAGIDAGKGSSVLRSTGRGWTAGIRARGYNSITNATGLAHGNESDPTWNGTAGLLISDAGVIAQGFRGAGLICVLPEFERGLNFIVDGAYCDGSKGPKLVVQGAGNQYLGVRAAWGSAGSVVSLGDPRGRCIGGQRDARVCVFGAGSEPSVGCPDGSCEPHRDFRAGSANHFVIGGGSLLHSDRGAHVSFVRATEGKRCSGGRDAGVPCVSDQDCAGGESCNVLSFNNALIDGVLFYAGGTGATAFDLGTTAIGVHRRSGPSIAKWLVSGVELVGFGRGLEFPPLERRCSGGAGAGANNGASCGSDEDCTGGGTPRCTTPVSDFVISGDASRVAAPLINWSWDYGDVSGLTGLSNADDQGQIVALEAGERLERGQLVSASREIANAVIKTTPASPEAAIGVVVNSPLRGHPAKVLISGTAACVAHGTMETGSQLSPSLSVPGSVEAMADGPQFLVGTALEPAKDGQRFRCLIRSSAGWTPRRKTARE